MLFAGLSHLSQSFGQNGFVGSSLAALNQSANCNLTTASSCTLGSPNPMTSTLAGSSMSGSNCNVMYSHNSSPMANNHPTTHQQQQHQGYMSSPANSGFFQERDIAIMSENAPKGAFTFTRAKGALILNLFPGSLGNASPGEMSASPPLPNSAGECVNNLEPSFSSMGTNNSGRANYCF